MKTLVLVIGLLLTVCGAVVSPIWAQIPAGLKDEMRLEKPEHKGPAIELKSDLVAAVLFYPKAKLWVVTKIHIIKPGHPLLGRFTDEDIETISREVDGKQVELYRKKREKKKQEENEKGELT